jgi:hypothetical protein
VAKIEEIVVKKSRQGSPMCYINGRISFPDKKHKIPDGVQIGDFWEVEIIGENSSKTVYFFRFLKKTRTEIMKVYVYGGKWGTEWMWSSNSSKPSLYKPGKSLEVEVAPGVWQAEVCGFYYTNPTARFIKKIASEEEMLREQEKIEREKNGGFLWVEIEGAWKEAKRQLKPRYRDSKDSIYYLNLAKNISISSLETLLNIMMTDLREMQTRHERKPVVFSDEATSKYKKWWNFIEKTKVIDFGLHTDYVSHVKSVESATKKDVENFLFSLGKNPEQFLIEEGYYDQDDDNYGHHFSD